MRHFKYMGSRESMRKLWENRESLDKYLAKLKKLMEADEKIRIMENEIPRRNRVDLYEPAELAIRKAVHEVENIGADIRLTDAVILLDKARNLVADYIDEKLNDSMKTLGKNR